MSGRDSVLWGIPASGRDFTRSLRLTYLMRPDGVLETSLDVMSTQVAPKLAAKEGCAAVTEPMLETMARVAFPGFAPVAPARTFFSGEVVRLFPQRTYMTVDTPAHLGAGAPGPRPAALTGVCSLFLPAGDVLTIALDRTLVALAEADASVDLALEVTPMPLSAKDLRALGEAKRRLARTVNVDGLPAAIQTMRSMAKIDDWLRASARVLHIEATLRFAGPAEPALVQIAAGLLFGPLAPAAPEAADVVDLSSCISPEHPLPVLVPMLVTPAALTEIARGRRLPPPKGIVVRFGVDAVGRDVAIGADDLRQHCYLVGATGTGKSTLLKIDDPAGYFGRNSCCRCRSPR